MERRSKRIAHFLSQIFIRKAHISSSEMSDMNEHEPADERMLRSYFSALPKQKCPKHVTQEILRMTVRQEKRSLQSLFDISLPWKISTGFAAAVAIAVLAFLISPKKDIQQPVQAAVSEDEVQRAKDQLKWSLVYASQLLNQSEKKAFSEAVMDELPKTLRNTLKKTVPLFKGGES